MKYLLLLLFFFPQDPEMPRFADLKPRKELPDPLVFLNGNKVKTKEDCLSYQVFQAFAR